MGCGETYTNPVVACPDCDLLQRRVAPPTGGTVRCRRCGRILARAGCARIELAAALVLAAAILFLMAHGNPVIGLEYQGTRRSTTMIGAVLNLWNQGRPLVALVVLSTTFLAPAAELLCLLAVLPPFRKFLPPAWYIPALLTLGVVRPWDMVEVLMLAVLVSLVKLTQFAGVISGAGLWSFAGLTLVLAAAAAALDPRELWRAHIHGQGNRTVHG